MKRIILMVISLGLKTFYYFFILLYISNKKNKDLIKNYALLRKMTISASANIVATWKKTVGVTVTFDKSIFIVLNAS